MRRDHRGFRLPPSDISEGPVTGLPGRRGGRHVGPRREEPPWSAGGAGTCRQAPAQSHGCVGSRRRTPGGAKHRWTHLIYSSFLSFFSPFFLFISLHFPHFFLSSDSIHLFFLLCHLSVPSLGLHPKKKKKNHPWRARRASAFRQCLTLSLLAQS